MIDLKFCHFEDRDFWVGRVDDWDRVFELKLGVLSGGVGVNARVVHQRVTAIDKLLLAHLDGSVVDTQRELL